MRHMFSLVILFLCFAANFVLAADCGAGFGTTNGGASCNACAAGVSFKRDIGNTACTLCAANTENCGGTYAGMCIDGYTRNKDGACLVTVVGEKKNLTGLIIGCVCAGLFALLLLYLYIHKDDDKVTQIRLLKANSSRSIIEEERSKKQKVFAFKKESKYTNLPGASTPVKV